MVSALCVLGTVATVGLTPGTGNAGTTTATHAARPLTRQLLGTISSGTEYYEASAHVSGTYVIEYEVTGVAFFGTYVDEEELGYVGGPTGTYRTREFPLSEGGHLVQAVGPEGYGEARIHLVQLSATAE